ncbi:carboxypeptidase B-like [Amphiura filiformis]|uniref:carboxypeptidase B-like n=1 Tax=Amphiura filiformis TaxID=82378 RepID=UPI003B218AE9
MAELIPFVLNCFIIIWICQSGSSSGSDAKRYDDFKIFQVTPENEYQLELLRGLSDMHNSYDWVIFWQEPNTPGEHVNLMVAPQDMNTLIDILHSHNINHQLQIENVQRLIDSNQHRDGFNQRKRGEYNFEHYQNYDEILEFMTSLETLYDTGDPDGLHISSFPIAETYEGRPITVLKLSAGESGYKPVIWMMGGIHAREWIGPATLMYITRELAKDWYGGDVRDILQEFDWYILPVLNVDGYVYTWTTDRLWRKTRSIIKDPLTENTRGCLGVDPNRNWDYHWNEKGTSKNVCDDNYPGTKPFSETEVKQIADFLTELNKHIPVVAFLDIHSYGQMWMSPFGYSDKKPDDFEKHMQLANRTTSALSNVHGTPYRTGNIAQVIYKASGNSVDWAYSVLGVEYSYAVELPDEGSEGFLLLPERITNVGEETYEAVKEMSKALLDVKHQTKTKE